MVLESMLKIVSSPSSAMQRVKSKTKMICFVSEPSDSGEALPSIASVSHLEMKTSTGEGAGTHLALQGGKIISEKNLSAAAPRLWSPIYFTIRQPA